MTSRIPTWLVLVVLWYALLRWRRACQDWEPPFDTDLALRLWQHDVAALSDAQLEALHAAFTRRRDEGLI